MAKIKVGEWVIPVSDYEKNIFDNRSFRVLRVYDENKCLLECGEEDIKCIMNIVMVELNGVMRPSFCMRFLKHDMRKLRKSKYKKIND